MTPWHAERAWSWYRERPWLVGCNHLPATAVNDIEMWRRETFDPERIAEELGWASDLGFNCLRVFVNCLVWEEDSGRLVEALDRFLAIAGAQGLAVMPVLLDDCNFAGERATAGPQPDPVPGVHNSRWVASPSADRVTDSSQWPPIEAYVRGVVSAFGADDRVLAWDLYNEPGNSGLGEGSLPLLRAAFCWAREIDPDQPLTAGLWTDDLPGISQACVDLSDIITFHSYTDRAGLERDMDGHQQHGRPLICTEWMARPLGGSWARDLPLFRERGVGCLAWGLVAGRTQTRFPWGSEPGAPEPEEWFHDLLHADGTPYDAREIAAIRSVLDG